MCKSSLLVVNDCRSWWVFGLQAVGLLLSRPFTFMWSFHLRLRLMLKRYKSGASRIFPDRHFYANARHSSSFSTLCCHVSCCCCCPWSLAYSVLPQHLAEEVGVVKCVFLFHTSFSISHLYFLESRLQLSVCSAAQGATARLKKKDCCSHLFWRRRWCCVFLCREAKAEFVLHCKTQNLLFLIEFLLQIS